MDIHLMHFINKITILIIYTGINRMDLNYEKKIIENKTNSIECVESRQIPAFH